MCIIIATYPSSLLILKSTVNLCADNNPDGCGLMWPEGGKVKIWKTMKDVDELYDRYVEAHSNGLPVVLHFRWATHGGRTIDNVHPFHIPNSRKQLGFVHNGVLDVPSTKEISDTRVFGRHVLAHLPANWRDDTVLRECYEEGFLGTGNKVVTLDHTGRIDILNEKLGLWHEESWFSNDGFKASRWSAYDDEWWNSKLAGIKQKALPPAASSVVGYSYSGWAFCMACVEEFHQGDPAKDPELTPICSDDAKHWEQCSQCEEPLTSVTPVPVAAQRDLEDLGNSVSVRLNVLSVTKDNPAGKRPGESQKDYLIRRRETYQQLAYDLEASGDLPASRLAVSHYQGFASAVLAEEFPNGPKFDYYVMQRPNETVSVFMVRRYAEIARRRDEASQKSGAWQQCIHGVAVKAYCVKCSSCVHGVAVTEHCSTCHSTVYAADVEVHGRDLELAVD